MRTLFGPLHLLAFGKSLTDDLIHRRFHKARRNRFLIPPPFAVVGNKTLVGGDVAVEFVQSFSELPPVIGLDLFVFQIAV